MTTLNATKVAVMREVGAFVDMVAGLNRVDLPADIKDMFVRFLVVDLINGDSETKMTIKLKNLIKTYKITVGV